MICGVGLIDFHHSSNDINNTFIRKVYLQYLRITANGFTETVKLRSRYSNVTCRGLRIEYMLGPI